MDPARPYNPFGNTQTHYPGTNKDVALKPIFGQKNIKNLPTDPDDLTEFCIALQKINAQLVKDNEDLKLEKQVAQLFISDEELLKLAQDRDCLQDWFDKMLGTNKELDDLNAAEKELKKFRQVLQLRLDTWKAQFNIYISLEKELQWAEEMKGKGKSVPELIAKLTAEIDQDFNTIFDQIEQNFKDFNTRKEELTAEVNVLTDKLQDRDRQVILLESDLGASNLVAYRCGESEEELKEAKQQLEDAKEEIEKITIEMTERNREIEELTAMRLEIGKMCIDWEAKAESYKIAVDELQLTNAKLQKQLHKMENEIIKELREELERKQEALSVARAALAGESFARQQVQKELDLQLRCNRDSNVLNLAQLKSEENRRALAERDAVDWKEKYTITKKLTKEYDNDSLPTMNAFMIRFIQKLDREYVQKLDVSIPEQFRIEFLEAFQKT